jgi:hypothetical protein
VGEAYSSRQQELMWMNAQSGSAQLLVGLTAAEHISVQALKANCHRRVHVLVLLSRHRTVSSHKHYSHCRFARSRASIASSACHLLPGPLDVGTSWNSSSSSSTVSPVPARGVLLRKNAGIKHLNSTWALSIAVRLPVLCCLLPTVWRVVLPSGYGEEQTGARQTARS